MNIKVLVAVHKNYAMPSDPMYLPAFVGKDLHPDVNDTFQGDNTGDNISKKNAHYNELTALYWGWKNLPDVDALGLVHYRRYFSLHHDKDLSKVLSTAEAENLLKDYDVILPKQRNYFIETNESHYLHVHEHEPLEVTREVINKKYPAYAKSFETVMKRTKAHYFNMMIMKKQPLDEYCTWLFDVLGEVEKRIDYSNYTPYEQRVFGFLSELLLDTWLGCHPEYRTVDVNYVFMEKQNWLLKGGKFLKRKIMGHGEH